jgi:flagellar motor switch protein FliM
VLSQGEIDSILNLLNDGKPDTSTEQATGMPSGTASRARLYDFRRPDRFSKDNLRALRMIHEAFCRSYGSSLSSYMRATVQIHLSSIEQMVYDDYIQQLPDVTLINIVDLNPLPGHAICEINLEIAFDMMDRLLGGTGADPRQAGAELTDIEYSIFRNLAGQLLVSYREAWASITSLDPQLNEIVMSPQFVRSALPGDMAVFVLCELKVGERSGTITFCLPYTMLESVMDRLSSQSWFTTGSRKASPTSHAEVQRQLRNVSVEASVALGSADLTFSELLNLQVGDVVKLDASVSSELTLRVEGLPKYACRAGLSGRRVGVQVTRTLTGDENP